MRTNDEHGAGAGGPGRGPDAERNGSHTARGGASGTALARPRWFTGQLVGAHDLGQWDLWATERLRRHNRLLHGWGVVCGAAVTAATAPDGSALAGTVDIAPGTVLAPQGDEITLGEATRVDVRQLAPAGPSAVLDPTWTYHLAVKYDETRDGAVSQVCAEGEECEYTRTREGWTFGLLDALPEHYLVPAPTGTLPETCPPPETSPWVILASLTVPATGAVQTDTTHRRRVYRPAAPATPPGPKTVQLTLTPNLVWMNENFYLAWNHRDGHAVTRTDTAALTSMKTLPAGGTTSLGMMSVSLPHDCEIKKLVVTGTRVTDRTLAITLYKQSVTSHATTSMTPVAVVKVDKHTEGVTERGFKVPAGPEPGTARVDTDGFRYFLIAEALKVNGAGVGLVSSEAAVLRAFQISYEVDGG